MRSLPLFSIAALAAVSFSASPVAQAQAQEYTAAQLIAGVKAAAPEGGLYVRLRMEHQPSAGAKAEVLQVQLKRRTAANGSTESLYQVLFPKERKGEGLLLSVGKNGGFTGSSYIPGQGIKSLQSSDRVFGTALTVDDLVADFLDWSKVQIVGQEKEGNTNCTIVESQPSKASGGIRRVRSWIDPVRLVALRIAQYKEGNQPVKEVVTNKMIRTDSGRYVPAVFTVTVPGGATTQIEGVRSGSGLTYSDADFSPTAFEAVTGPPK